MTLGYSATEAASRHFLILLLVSIALLLFWLSVVAYLMWRRGEIRFGGRKWCKALWLGFPAILGLVWIQGQVRHFATEILLYAGVLVYVLYLMRSISKATPSNSLISTFGRYFISRVFVLFVVLGSIALVLGLGGTGYAIALGLWGLTLIGTRIIGARLSGPGTESASSISERTQGHYER